MPHPDRSLRRLVAQLAMLDPDDVSVILEALSAEDRRVVEGLLRECAGPVSAEPAAIATTYDAVRFSPWLIALFEGTGPVLPRPRQIMRESAVRLYPAVPLAAAESAKTRGATRFVSLFSRESR